MIEGFAVVEQIPVQWGDMDALGHVNNARFFTWFETARIAYFRAIGFGADRSGGVGPILAHTSCDFLAPVEYPGEILAGARVTRLGRTSFNHEYVIVPSDRPSQPWQRGPASSSSTTTGQTSRCRYPTTSGHASGLSTDSTERLL